MRSHSLSISAAMLAALFILSACNDRSKQPVEEVVAPAPVAEATTAAAMEVSVPAETVAPASASAYEGKIVRRPPSTGGKEDGWFFVKDGKRRWISDAAWLEKNGYQVTDVMEIPAEELQAIPEDMEAIAP